MNPEVSVILYYNRDRGWLHQAKASVYNQTYKGKIQLIISNNETFNASQNLNAGIKQATGKYLKYLSEDDMLTVNCIEDSVNTMESTGADLMHGNAWNLKGGRMKEFYPRELYPTFETEKHNNVFHGGTLFYRTELFKEKLFDETLNCAEEYDVNLYFMSKDKKLAYCNKFLYIYRRHGKQKSLGDGVNQTQRQEIIKSIRERY